LLVSMPKKTNKKTVQKEVVVVEVGAHSERNRRRRVRKRERLNVAMQSLSLRDPMSRLPGNSTRSGVSPNPADPRTLVGAITQLGNTDPGRVDTLRILHPCAEGNLPAEYTVKVPDGAVDYSLTFPRRDEYHIQAPPPLTGQPDASWNCIVFHLPFVKRTRMAIGWRAGVLPLQVDFERAFIELLSYNDPGDTGSTVPVYPDWGGIAGAVSGLYAMLLPSDQLTPGMFTKHAGDLLAFRSIRRVNYGCTTDLDSPALANQGRYIGVQVAPDLSLGSYTENAAVPGTSPAFTALTLEADVYYIVLPPVTTAEMVGIDPRAREGEAREGAYMPLRPSQPNWPMTASAEYRLIRVEVSDLVPADYTGYDIQLQGWLVGVEKWDEISSTGGLRLKLRETLELVPAVKSDLSSLSTPGHPCDDRSAAVIREFCRTEPHAYPADFNESNGFWSELIRGIGSVVGSLGIPVVSGLAAPLANAVANFV